MRLWHLVDRYRNVILYVVFGALTTLVNIVAYYLFAHVFGASVMASTIIAWILSVAFAYVTNRIWVFESRVTGVMAIALEAIEFVGCRIATGALDLACMFVFVDVLGLNDLAIKVLSNVVVIVLNYLASKLFIFK